MTKSAHGTTKKPTREQLGLSERTAMTPRRRMMQPSSGEPIFVSKGKRLPEQSHHPTKPMEGSAKPKMRKEVLRSPLYSQQRTQQVHCHTTEAVAEQYPLWLSRNRQGNVKQLPRHKGVFCYSRIPTNPYLVPGLFTRASVVLNKLVRAY